MRALLLDDGLPASLAGELERRGRPARTVREARLQDFDDAELLERAGDVVLVTTEPRLLEARPPGSTVALVAGRDEVARRELVHRYAHSMAAQRPGSGRSYA